MNSILSDIHKYIQAKKKGYREVIKKNFNLKKNNNSADFIMPCFAIGCENSCVYCYTSRHNTFGNPIKLSRNIEDILENVVDFYYTLPKKKPNQQDKKFFVLELGENSDLLTSSLIDYTNYFIEEIINRTNFKTTFASKSSNKYSVSKLINAPKPFQSRVRVSLMPQSLSNILEPGTSRIIDRILSIKYLYNKNYEIHVNFAPVVLYNNWIKDYLELFKLIDSQIKSFENYSDIILQLKCEVIFLTHHPKAHNNNLLWNKEAEDILWTPSFQEYKTNKKGSTNILRYKLDIKKQAISIFKQLLKQYLPYCQIRYIF